LEGEEVMVRTIRRSYFGVFAGMAAMVLLCVLAGSSGAAAGDTIRVSVDSSGNQADEGPAGQGSYEAYISSDGRHVAFSSYASDLVEGDTNAKSDIFVRDRDTDNDNVFDEPGAVSTERVSVSSSGTQGNGFSSNASISSDGRYVTFISEAQNLVEGDIGYRDVFVRDRDTDADGVFDEPGFVSTEKVTNMGGTDPNQAPPSISSDGRYVAFTSDASNVVEGDTDTNNDYDVFVHDRTTATTERVSVGLDVSGSGTDADGGSDDASISSDGDYVVFRSSASNLVVDDFNGEADVFVRDLQSGTTQLVSIDSSGNQANSYSFYPSISADGRYVAFGSPATNLVTGDTNDQPDVFMRDRTEGITQRVNLDPCGAQANSGEYLSPDISPDGRYVAFTSGFPNQGRGGFVRDLQSQTTQSVDGGGGSLSADARFIAFHSSTPVTADDTNGLYDIYVHERHTVTTQSSDCIAPTTTASATTSSGAAYEQGIWTNKDVKVTFSAQDNADGFGLKDIVYLADGAQSLPRTVYDPQNPPIINTDGMTRIIYSATDNAGNRESGKTFTVMLDKTAPETEIVSGPPAYANSTSASFSVSKAASEDGWMVTFQCRLDGGTFATCPQHKSYSSLSQGKHTFEARTVDKASNIDASPAIRSWYVDTAVPRGTVSINAGAASTRSQSVKLSLSASDPSPASGVVSVRFRNENTTAWSGWFDYSSSMPWQLSNGAGTKTVYAQFQDRAGNVSATASDKIKFSP
jgi:Tol biopolymer transport system component